MNTLKTNGTQSVSGSYVVSQDIHWFETIYGKCLHKRTNQRSNHYMRRGGGVYR